ncbi:MULTISPECIES: LuxR C-terminal-related transcriptional regulator [unclassified Streptomyces]
MKPAIEVSPRETEAAEPVARGVTNRGIAGALFISERTGPPSSHQT